MKKNLIKVLAVIFVLLLLCGCGKKEDASDSTAQSYITTEPQTTVVYNFHTEEMIISAPETNVIPSQIPESVTASEVTTQEQVSILTPVTNTPIQSAQNETTAETTEKVYEKTGEMAFSDKADNKFIKAIAGKYGVDPKNLVALYTVPENNGNMVLQFNGTTDGDGKLIRNKNTLVAIYTIDKDLNSKRASKDSNLNEYSYGEMMVMYMTTTTYIIPEFETELNG